VYLIVCVFDRLFVYLIVCLCIWVLQGKEVEVDDHLQSLILRTASSFRPHHTIVLLTGDGNSNYGRPAVGASAYCSWACSNTVGAGRGTFPHCVEVALAVGHCVEVSKYSAHKQNKISARK
jgi:hypothetical protein